jgi:hypothetical protein
MVGSQKCTHLNKLNGDTRGIYAIGSAQNQQQRKQVTRRECEGASGQERVAGVRVPGGGGGGCSRLGGKDTTAIDLCRPTYCPVFGTRPPVGLCPKIPLKAAGMRMLLQIEKEKNNANPRRGGHSGALSLSSAPNPMLTLRRQHPIIQAPHSLFSACMHAHPPTSAPNPTGAPQAERRAPSPPLEPPTIR